MQNNSLLRNVNTVSSEIKNIPTIGIAGVTIPGAVDCISKINIKMKEKFNDHNHPNIILHQPNFGPTHQAQNAGRWDIVEYHLIESIESLKKSGADFAIIPANTVHKVIDNVKRLSPIPVLNMLDLVAAECKQHKLKKVGILGTKWTMTGHLYQATLASLDMEEIIPTKDDQFIVHNAIFDELIPAGKVTPETFASLLAVAERLKSAGCDAIVLACTELPLVLSRDNCGIHTLDTTAILAEAAVERAYSLLRDWVLIASQLQIYL